MMSERNDGASIAEITGKYLGPVMQNVMRVFSVVLLIMVGTVFAVGPAGLIVELCSQSGASGVLTSLLFWLIIILVYYFIATFISIDAVIGKIYPIFGICLIIMAIGVIFGIVHQSRLHHPGRSGITLAACIRRALPSGASCSSPLPVVQSPASTPPSRP